MNDIQLFAFVYLPIGVLIYGCLLGWVGMKLINWADRRRERAADTYGRG